MTRTSARPYRRLTALAQRPLGGTRLRRRATQLGRRDPRGLAGPHGLWREQCRGHIVPNRALIYPHPGQERVPCRDHASPRPANSLPLATQCHPGPGSQGTDNGNAPRRLQGQPWEEADKALVTLALDTSPSSHGVELDTEVSVIVKDMTLDLDDSLQGLAEDSGATITVFSFSRFAEEQAGNLGAEIGILTSASIAILGSSCGGSSGASGTRAS